jgi:hypothetical protein
MKRGARQTRGVRSGAGCAQDEDQGEGAEGDAARAVDQAEEAGDGDERAGGRSVSEERPSGEKRENRGEDGDDDGGEEHEVEPRHPRVGIGDAIEQSAEHERQRVKPEEYEDSGGDAKDAVDGPEEAERAERAGGSVT